MFQNIDGVVYYITTTTTKVEINIADLELQLESLFEQRKDIDSQIELKYKEIEEVNKLISAYEVDRQNLADKYVKDLEKMTKSMEDKKAKLFDDYKKYQDALDASMLDGVIDKKEQKLLDKLSK